VLFSQEGGLQQIMIFSWRRWYVCEWNIRSGFELCRINTSK
jgi:hypothetical protein